MRDKGLFIFRDSLDTERTPRLLLEEKYRRRESEKVLIHSIEDDRFLRFLNVFLFLFRLRFRLSKKFLKFIT